MQLQCGIVSLVALVAIGSSSAVGEKVSPLEKTLQLIKDLSAKIKKDGEAEEAAYQEYTGWCKNMAQDIGFVTKTASAKKEKLEVKIDELSSVVKVTGSKIDKLAADIAASNDELKSATKIRNQEQGDFSASEKELVSTVDTLGRAISVLEREMQKSPASFAQLNGTGAGVQDILRVLSALVDAAALPASDKQKLVALVQSKQSSESDDEEELGAPAASAYTTHSSSTVDVLEDMLDKAQTQLSTLRKAEVAAKNAYELNKQSLEDQLAADEKEMEDEKARRAAAEEGKGEAEGELAMATKELATAKKEREDLSSSCMQTAADHEASVKARAEELQALAKAVELLDTTKAADKKVYSFLAVKMQTHADSAGTEVVASVTRLAKQHHSAALAQLASEVAAAVRFGASGGQAPFAKVRDLIGGLISRLEEQASAEASEKAYCDDEMSKTVAKKEELSADLSKLKSRMDQATAKSARLKEEVGILQQELAAVAKEQAVMDQVRQESHASYVESKANLEQGLAGIRGALNVLREYYASDDASASMLQDSTPMAALMQQPELPKTHKKAAGAGSGIIGLLEVAESDLASELAKLETQEEDEASHYEETAQENKVVAVSKQQDVKYKGKALALLAKTIAELTSDKETMSTEQSAVLEYYGKLKEQCIAKPVPYEERKKRREAEIKGLKGALAILSNEVAFAQRHRRGSRHGFLERD